MLKFFAGLTACFVVLCAGYALASRNSTGTMSQINGPYTSGTVISSSIINARLSDIENEISDSKSRSGKGDFSAPVRGADGLVSAPTWSFTNDTGSGLYRIGSNDLGWAINGTKKLELTSALFTITPNATLSGVASIGAALPTTSTTTPFSAIGAGPMFSVISRSGVNTRIGANTYFNGSNDTYNATGFAGMLQLGGLTSADFVFYTAPSGTGGTSATFTERLKVNESGVTIGGGTAISARYRGTTSWTPGSIASSTGTSTTITVTGAAAGADCRVTPPGIVGAFTVACLVTLNTCTVNIYNTYASSASTGAAGTWSCVVENP